MYINETTRHLKFQFLQISYGRTDIYISDCSDYFACWFSCTFLVSSFRKSTIKGLIRADAPSTTPSALAGLNFQFQFIF